MTRASDQYATWEEFRDREHGGDEEAARNAYVIEGELLRSPSVDTIHANHLACWLWIGGHS